MYPEPKFCSACGHPVAQRIPADDSRLRHVCTNSDCGAVHYINPKVVLGTIPMYGEQVMLCRRAIEPRYGYWTLPAGFMEINESVHQGAARETLEEAGARVRLGPPFTIFDVQRAQQVHMFFRAELLDLEYAAGPESLEVKMFHEHEIPWDDLAFMTVSKTLKLFFEDRRSGHFRLHSGDLYDATSWPADAFHHPG